LLPASIISKTGFHELTLLTLGPQLRGGVNNSIGRHAHESVFRCIQEIIAHFPNTSSAIGIELVNASKRRISILCGSDPDIAVTEMLSNGQGKKLLAMEIKGGADRSNIWNRLGEAEKSHQSAKKAGYRECWTLHNVGELDLSKAQEKSPTTTQFFSMKELSLLKSPGYLKFSEELVSLLGIPAKRQTGRKVPPIKSAFP
jgi:hypothetical protein